jgi:hypothetical protein
MARSPGSRLTRIAGGNLRQAEVFADDGQQRGRREGADERQEEPDPCQAAQKEGWEQGGRGGAGARADGCRASAAPGWHQAGWGRKARLLVGAHWKAIACGPENVKMRMRSASAGRRKGGLS